jgi:hypothetical protein
VFQQETTSFAFKFTPTTLSNTQPVRKFVARRNYP